ncbi:MRPL39 mitochondrial ribosomal protein-like protein of the large subunit [Lipomyces arxii]|uniref:mitochondrial 54S ribosomal protein bL33m n=1 Tax=Lipomyces arxii TaxID=56418 RepID=UPI0034CE09B0
MAKKQRGRLTIVKLVSTATGYIKSMYRLRQAPPMVQIRYDPLAKRHVLFEESKRRRTGDTKVFGFGRPYKDN